MYRLVIPFVLLANLGGQALAEGPALVPFAVDWNRPPESPASLAFLLDAPAGKDGFIDAANGHLVTAAGDRFRIWGINITAKATIPPQESAEKLAGHLARCGINCVRFHFLDRSAPNGLIDANRNHTRALDADQLDRLDFFIAKLKGRGIYTNLNLNVGRTYKAEDGIPDYELLGFAKALTYFHPRLIELQKEYAHQLLTHRNPYTSNEYRYEPAVAIVELVNENSIVESWFSGRLLGKNTRKNPGTWTDIPAGYAAELTASYNQWLQQHLSRQDLTRLRSLCDVPEEAEIPRLQPEQFRAAAKERFYTEASFYMDLEQQYFDNMARYLKDELGVKSLLVGTSDHNHGKSGYPLLASTSRLDVVDGHVYWQHPRYLTDPDTGRRAGFRIPNTPMVNDPLHSTVVQLSRSAVAGKPYTVSEVNHPFPNEYACEGIPILAAFAALHDWDGLFWYTLTHNHLVGERPPAMGHFDIAPDPVKMAQLAAGDLLFLRGDVQAAEQVVHRSYTTEQIVESLRLSWSDAPYFTPGFPTGLPLIHATRIASFDGPATGSFAEPPREPFVSDTQQLRWDGAANKTGVVTVDTARSQSIIGFSTATSPETKHLALNLTVPFSAVTLNSLDDQPIGSAGKLLLTVTARVANTGMQWNADRTSLEKWGKRPSLIEPVSGSVRVKNLTLARSATAESLSGAGHPLGPPIEMAETDTGWKLELGTPPTVWYVIAVER